MEREGRGRRRSNDDSKEKVEEKEKSETFRAKPQNVVLQVGQFLLAGCYVDHQLVLALFQLRPLLSHHNTQQLGLQSLFLHREIDDGRLCGDLWCVVWVAEFGGDVELEVGIVVHFLVPQSNDHSVTFDTRRG